MIRVGKIGAAILGAMQVSAKVTSRTR